MADKLTDKQEKFCIEYVLNNGNAAKAARDAGYSEDTDKEIGFSNLTKVHLIKRIDELRKELGQEEFGVQAEWIIARLKALVERCMQLEKAKVTIGISDDGSILQEEGIFEFNASGAAKALDQLAKIKQLYTDKSIPKPKETDEERLARIQKRKQELLEEENNVE